ncbi:hypothetical protein [Cryobacterium sp.]|uniref:hypothetical protein n=1 Tax=Cryobacterium sp. TaxID=1926290 RepID=UPI00345D48CE
MTGTVEKTLTAPSATPVVVNRGTDFNTLTVVHTRHYLRWIFGALVLFVVLQRFCGAWASPSPSPRWPVRSGSCSARSLPWPGCRSHRS